MLRVIETREPRIRLLEESEHNVYADVISYLLNQAIIGTNTEELDYYLRECLRVIASYNACGEKTKMIEGGQDDLIVKHLSPKLKVAIIFHAMLKDDDLRSIFCNKNDRRRIKERSPIPPEIEQKFFLALQRTCESHISRKITEHQFIDTMKYVYDINKDN